MMVDSVTRPKAPKNSIDPKPVLHEQLQRSQNIFTASQ
jgi:hypothetical protein